MADNADNSASGVGPQKQLLLDAAAEIRADQIAREEARPKNIGEGALRLAKDSLSGAAVGTAAVIMGPVQGFKDAGPKGLLTGVVGGLAFGVASISMGIGSGVINFAQGASQSVSKLSPPSQDPRLVVTENPSGTAHSTKDQYFEQRKRMYGDLMEEFSAESAAASMDGLAAPVEDDLYRILEVDVDATPAQLRKSYYRMAQRYHPDKHPDDPEATTRFQEISSAYQILSDPVKREEYHRLGAAAASGDSVIDSKALFALMFADFEHIVGDLATATILKAASAENSGDNQASGEAGLASLVEARQKKREQFQKIREANLVKLLNRRLEPYMAGDEEYFIAQAKLEVLYLREQPFGRDCLHTAGYIYRRRASKVLNQKGLLTGVRHFFDDISEKTHSFNSRIRALEGGLKALSASSTANEDESIDDTARREAVSTLGAVWLESVVDIESTLRHVVAKVLHFEDKEMVKSVEVKKNAEGMMVLGKIFAQA